MCFVLIICSVLWSKEYERSWDPISCFEWRCEADFIKVILNLMSSSSAEKCFDDILFICNSEDFKDDNEPLHTILTSESWMIEMKTQKLE
jgi:hypothetical protein